MFATKSFLFSVFFTNTGKIYFTHICIVMCSMLLAEHFKEMAADRVCPTVAVLLALCALHGYCSSGEDNQCPTWYFTPVNSTHPCSLCSWALVSSALCYEGEAFIDASFIVTATNGSYPLFLGKCLFGLDRTENLMELSPVFRRLPSNISDLEEFFCGQSERQGYLCGQCRAGCGISLYTYYGLPCACPCNGYGIPLFLLLEIAFSTLFFFILVLFNFSANSSKWITVILYFQVIAYLILNEQHAYTTLAMAFPRVLTAIISLYGVWNMDFLRLVIPPFCVSPNTSVLGAISSGYISAFWPLVLVLLTSLAVYLHKYNFKIVVYPWKLVTLMSPGVIRRQLSRVNLIHTFATLFRLSFLKMMYVSTFLLTSMKVTRQATEESWLQKVDVFSLDPNVKYLSYPHAFYALPAVMVVIVIGVLLPIALILYPTRCGTWFGSKVPSQRARNAVKTFFEAVNGSYKDGSSGTRDYRALPGVLLLLISSSIAFFMSREIDTITTTASYFHAALFFMIMGAFFGLCSPYKEAKHSLNDVLILCLASAQCICFYAILSVSKVEHLRITIVLLILLPLLPIIFVIVKPCFRRNMVLFTELIKS